MHKVICDGCGKKCEVPFKPTESKPVYCRECFNKTDNNKRRDSRESVPQKDYSEEINALDTKLDAVLDILHELKLKLLNEKNQDLESLKPEIVEKKKTKKKSTIKKKKTKKKSEKKK